MKHHPLSELFPMLVGGGLQALADDIKARGLRDSVVLLNGMILDGRNRWAACRKAGIKQVPTVEYDGDDALAFVVSANLHRRHLSVSQRALIAADLAKRKSAEMRSDGKSAEMRPTLEAAAAALNVGSRVVDSASAVLEQGTPAEIEAVRSGEATATATAAQIRERKKAEEVRKAAKDDPERFGDLAERLKGKDADVDAVHREFKKRQKAGTVKKDVLKDALGVDVPAGLRDLFGDPWLMQTAEAVEGFVRDALKSIRAKVERKGPRYKFLVCGSILKALDAAKLELETAHSLLCEARPHAVCPKCGGAGCKLCREAGWLTSWRLKELKAEGQL
jgi:ParB-like chromosome segregation protein Spo0J